MAAGKGKRWALIALVVLAVLIAGGIVGFRVAVGVLESKVVEALGPDGEIKDIRVGWSSVDVGELRLADLHSYVERTFRHVADSKGLEFSIELHPALPKAMFTDSKRLQQVIKNLLSNAFKFTREGRVSLGISALQ